MQRDSVNFSTPHQSSCIHLAAPMLACSVSNVTDWASLQSWVNGPVQAVVPHQASIFGQSIAHSGGFAGIQRWSIGVPPCYLAKVTRPGYNMRSPIFERLLHSGGKPAFFNATRDGASITTEWLHHFKQAGWRNLLGMVYQTGKDDDAILTTIGLYNVAPETERHAGALQTLLMPHFHAALSQTYAAMQADKVSLPQLTPSEAALIPHLTDGKTTKEIAKLLQKSDHTLKHQLAALMHKYHAKTRTELVTRLKKPPH